MQDNVKAKSPPISKISLIWPVALAIILPLITAWFAYPTTHLPPGFGVFPPLFVQDPPGFNLTIFIVLAIIELGILAFLIFPQWFGFKVPAPTPMPVPGQFPIWFWLGGAVTLFFWWLMWTRTPQFGALVYYAFTPLWWGFIIMLDGLVYKRTGGYSLLASRPKTLAISAIVSLVGWTVFEYFDYFALGNWYYPHTNIPDLSHATIVALFLVAYTTVWPAIFQWYNLLNTIPGLAHRYSQGPKLVLPGNALLWAGIIMLGIMVFYPYPLFWVMWIGPLAVFGGLLISLNVWTPFSEVAEGNWSPMILMALSTLLNGFFWEVWNWGSNYPAWPITNPNFWMYDIPYVNVIHICAEMPLLGYLGYMPFGILAWLMFIWMGQLFGFNTALLRGGSAKHSVN